MAEVIAGTAAARSEVQPGDILLSIGGQRLDAATTLSEALFNFEPGDTVPVTLLRGTDEIEIDVTLGERPPE